MDTNQTLSDEELLLFSQEMEGESNANTNSDEDLILASQQAEENLYKANDISDSQSKRFLICSEKDLTECVKGAVPKNTLRRNSWACNTFKSWSVWRNNQNVDENKILKDILDMSNSELNYWLSRFVLEVRKVDGSYYPPNSILSMVMGLASYIKVERKVNIDILSNSEFEEFRQVLDGQMKKLSNMGLGNLRKQAEPITDNEEEQMWKCGVLGSHNPRLLVNTLIYLNGLHFSLRSGQEHRKLRFKNSQICLLTSIDGTSFLRYKEDVSKTYQGGLKHRKVAPKTVDHYPNSDKNKCHIEIYKKYMAVCPSVGRDDAFYLTPLKQTTDNLWFSKQPMGHNTIQKVVPDLCKRAGISGHKTNHSLRVTTATKLFSKDVPEQLIMERTGHRSIEGVRVYKRTTDEQKRHVSDLLQESGPSTSYESEAKNPN